MEFATPAGDGWGSVDHVLAGDSDGLLRAGLGRRLQSRCGGRRLLLRDVRAGLVRLLLLTVLRLLIRRGELLRVVGIGGAGLLHVLEAALELGDAAAEISAHFGEAATEDEKQKAAEEQQVDRAE